MEQLSIYTITDLQLHVRNHVIPRVHIQRFVQIYEISIQTLPVKTPPCFKYHRKSKNLYFTRYGARWVEKLKSSTAMSKLCLITDLICFMTNKVEKLIKGSVHEGNLFIVHNALVLMTAKEKISWMRQNGYLHRWLFPLN